MRRFIASVVVCSAALAVGISDASASSSPSANVGEPAAGSTSQVDGGHATGEAMLAYGQQQFANQFGGVTLENDGNDVVVHLTSLDSSTESAISSAPGVDSSVPVRYQLIATTVAQQDALHAAVTQDVIGGYWSKQGIDVASWGPDSTTGDEDLSVVNLTDSASARLTARYGANVAATAVTPAAADLQTASRTNDTSPFNGSDFITDESSFDCTSGIPVHSSTADYIITAAHCFTLNTNIFNGSVVFGYGQNPPTAMGSITQRDTSSGGLDAELEKVSSSDLLYTGPAGNPSRSIVSGRTSVIDGDQVCADGAFSGEVCAATIKHHGLCVTEDTGRYVCSISEAIRSDETPVIGQGDSGGPLFEFSGSNLEVVGTIVALYGDVVSCDANAGHGRECSNGVAFSDLGPELTDFSSALTLNTG